MKNISDNKLKYSLKILWLYPDLMNTYGDRGNCIVLQKRCFLRDINVSILFHTVGSSIEDIKNADILLMGGAQDIQQKIVLRDFLGKKSDVLTQKIEKGTPGLFVCGAYQFLGAYYKAADGTTLKGLSIFDVHTIHPGYTEKRLVGNVIAEWNNLKIVGFENHGGRTFLGKNAIPFAHMIKGFGNNGDDLTEGLQYKNVIGTYLHGPLLPKNPQIADWLIGKALKNRGTTLSLVDIESFGEDKARSVILSRLLKRR